MGTKLGFRTNMIAYLVLSLTLSVMKPVTEVLNENDMEKTTKALYWRAVLILFLFEARLVEMTWF